MDNNDWDEKLIWAIDLKHEDVKILSKKSFPYLSYSDKRLHLFCEKVEVSIIPSIARQGLKGFNCVFQIPRKDLGINPDLEKAIIEVTKFCKSFRNNHNTFLVEEEHIKLEREELKNNPRELSKLPYLHQIHDEYFKKEKDLTLKSIDNITHIPYKLNFIDVLISTFEKRGDFGKKMIIELKILRNSMSSILQEKEFDFDENFKLKASEQIILLNQLGVLDYLKNKPPFDTSTNQLAKVVSLILNQKQTTVQSYLNPIINTTANQNKSPLNNFKKVDKINELLIRMGFKPTL